MKEQLSPFLQPAILRSYGLEGDAAEVLLKAQQRGSISPDEVANLLPVEVATNPKKLSVAITKVMRLIRGLKITLSIEKVRLPQKTSRKISVSYIHSGDDDNHKNSNSNNRTILDDSDFIPEFIFDKADRSDLPVFYRQVLKYPLLNQEDERELSKKIRVRSDRRSLSKLVVHNLRLVLKNASRYLGRGLDFDDLVQEGSIGLMTAAERFDGRKGFKFSTYATWWIRQGMVRAIQNYGKTIRTPTYISELGYKVMNVATELARELRREPTIEEIAARGDFTAREVTKTFKFYNVPMVSLDEIVGEESDGVTLGDFVSDSTLLDSSRVLEAKEELQTATAEIRLLLAILECLGESKRDRDVFRMLYGLGKDRKTHTNQVIADKLDASRGLPYIIQTKLWAKLHDVGVVLNHSSLFYEVERISVLEDLVGEEVLFEVTPDDTAKAAHAIEVGKQNKNLPPLTGEGDEGTTPEVKGEAVMNDTSTENAAALNIVLLAVERWSGVSYKLLVTRGRKVKVNLARQVAMYLLRTDYGLSFSQIGALFDGRDHTTVIHNCYVIQVLVEEDPHARKEINEIRSLYNQITSPSPELKPTPPAPPVNGAEHLALDLAAGWGVGVVKTKTH